MFWLLADEQDVGAFARLGAALKELGYVVNEHEWGVGGSQELSTWELGAPGGSIMVCAETYMGLSVSGPSALIAALRERYSAADE